MKAPRLSEADRIIAIALVKEGYSHAEVAKKLKVNQSTITKERLVLKYKATNSVKDLFRRPKARISTPADDRQLARLVRKNRRASSTILANEWNLSNGLKAAPS